MGCGCGASRVVTPQAIPAANFQQTVNTPADCPYTLAQMQVWLTKLLCCKDKRTYTSLGVSAPTMNKYIGVVMSTLNYPTNPCYYQSDLAVVSDFIILLTNTGQC